MITHWILDQLFTPNFFPFIRDILTVCRASQRLTLKIAIMRSICKFIWKEIPTLQKSMEILLRHNIKILFFEAFAKILQRIQTSSWCYHICRNSSTYCIRSLYSDLKVVNSFDRFLSIKLHQEANLSRDQWKVGHEVSKKDYCSTLKSYSLDNTLFSWNIKQITGKYDALHTHAGATIRISINRFTTACKMLILS